MSITLYVASTNAGKLRDFAVASAAHDLLILPIPRLNQIPPAPEEEPTFEGNARSKAIYYSQYLPGEIVLADDSGLEVDALQGAPGVRSARYAADAGRTDNPDANDNSDVWNNMLLLTNMADVRPGMRQGHYRCVLAAAKDGECLFTASGSVDGEILTAPRGTGGFGYDPLFYLPELELTMAEIDIERKHSLSHRGRAFRALLEPLLNLIESH
jgi:XTP/dITP diphosphohydrolase